MEQISFNKKTRPPHINLLLSLARLSSIDTKYHVWKLGVVFTDNVSWNTPGVGDLAPWTDSL